jgi:hypothetical protein
MVFGNIGNTINLFFEGSYFSVFIDKFTIQQFFFYVLCMSEDDVFHMLIMQMHERRE